MSLISVVLGEAGDLIKFLSARPVIARWEAVRNGIDGINRDGAEGYITDHNTCNAAFVLGSYQFGSRLRKYLGIKSL